VGLAEEAVGNTSLEERLLRVADESMYRDKNVEPIGKPGRRALRDQTIHETG
jgi:hypothetical protein